MSKIKDNMEDIERERMNILELEREMKNYSSKKLFSGFGHKSTHELTNEEQDELK